jgi:2-oxoisovalerate dehydrogenase E1 component
MTVDTDRLLEMQRRMLRIRYFEEAVKKAAKRGQFPGSVHLSIGQEAEVVGACMALRSDDYMTGNHRSHGHPIGKGAQLRPLMAEIFGRATGVCKGKGGSMHLADFSVGSLGESGVVGSAIPIATGAGFSARARGTDQVALCFFGDGGANQGALHESMNLAGIWNLPVIYLCENNQFAVTTAAKDAIAGGDVAARAAGYGMPGVVVADGQDVLAVYAAVSEAVARARAGEGPSLVEVRTYRFHDHSEGLRHAGTGGGDPERDTWIVRDPVVLFRQRLIDEHGIAEAALDDLDLQVRDEVDDALQFARSSPFPDPESAYDDLYSTRPAQPVATTRPRGPAPPPGETATHTYLAAIGRAQGEVMEEDPRVVMLGEDLRGNLYGTTPDFVARFGRERVWDTPLSEAGFSGLGAGAAMTGLRPIVDLTYSSFMYLTLDQLINQVAKNRYMFGGQATIPVTYRSSMFYGSSMAAHHSDRPYPMLMNVPGLTVLAPATPYDAYGLLRSAVQCDDPVVVFEDATLWFRKQDLPVARFDVPIGVADVVSEGTDVTLVAISGSRQHAASACQQLADEGISVELIDPRTLVPLDTQTILDSVRRTRRLVVAEPAHRTCGAAGEIITLVCEHAFDALAAAPQRVTTPDIQIPFSPPMEKPLYPDAARIAAAVRAVMGVATDSSIT